MDQIVFTEPIGATEFAAAIGLRRIGRGFRLAKCLAGQSSMPIAAAPEWI